MAALWGLRPSRWTSRWTSRSPGALLLAAATCYCFLVGLLLNLLDPPPTGSPRGQRPPYSIAAPHETGPPPPSQPGSATDQRSPPGAVSEQRRPPPGSAAPHYGSSLWTESCRPSPRRADTDIHLPSVLPELDFTSAVTEDTFWNDNMERRYREISENPPFPLKILVVPHHSGSGRCQRLTQVSCFRLHARPVLDAAVQLLPRLPQMRLTWSDVSLLQLWWEDASKSRRAELQRLVASGQLEIGTGGWTVPDETVTELYSLLDQLTEGHEWLRYHLNVSSVVSGWSVDNAGHGSTLPYLLRQAGVQHSVIRKTSPILWKYLAEEQSSEFIWQQEWDMRNSSSLLTHHLPHFTQSVTSSCGAFRVSPKLCESLDFTRNPPPTDAEFDVSLCQTSSKIKEQTELLVELAGKTASFSGHNVALLLLDATGRFEHETSWLAEARGYSQLAACLAHRAELRAELQLATAADFLREVNRRRSASGAAPPSLSGELLASGARADRYTGLPEWRRAARQLQAELRAAELLYAWSWSRHREQTTVSVFHHAYHRLRMSRQDVGLFRHHRTSAGGVVPEVLADYAERLAISQLDLTHVQLTGAAELFMDLEFYGRLTELFTQHAPLQHSLGEPPRHTVFAVRRGEKRRLLLFNPLAQRRTELVTLLVRRPGVNVTDDVGRPVPLQVSARPGSTLLVQFLARLQPTALHVFHVRHVPEPPPLTAVRADAELNDTFTIDNMRFQLTFSKSDGMFSLLDRRTEQRRPLGLAISALNTAGSPPLLPLPCERAGWTVHTGSAFSEAAVPCGRVLLTVRLYHSARALGQAVHLQVETRPPVGDEPRDLALLLRTDVRSCVPRGCGLYADANDYRMVWRPHVHAAGAAANISPATSQISLEDVSRRVSLLMDHSRGVASFEEGELVAILDSQLDNDADEAPLSKHKRRSVLASFFVTFDYLTESEPEPGLQSESEPWGSVPAESSLEPKTGMELESELYPVLEPEPGTGLELELNLGPAERQESEPRTGLEPEPEPGSGERLFAPGALSDSLARRLSHPVVSYLSSDPSSPPLRSPLRLLNGALPCGWELLSLRQLPDPEHIEQPGDTVLLSLLRRRLDCRLADARDGLGCRPASDDTAQVDFHPPVETLGLQETTVTGGELSPRPAELRHLRHVRLRPDELRSFRVSFVPATMTTTTSGRPGSSELALVRSLNKLDESDELL